MASGGGNVSEGSSLKSAQLLDLVKTHLTTDAGKELQKKVGFVYQINIAPKVTQFLLRLCARWSLFFSSSFPWPLCVSVFLGRPWKSGTWAVNNFFVGEGYVSQNH